MADTQRLLEIENTRDLRRTESQVRANLGMLHNGNVSLAYLRGFQAGYERACRDAKRGKLHKDNALRPGRDD